MMSSYYDENFRAKIKLLTDTAQVPAKGSIRAAGYDLYADDDAVIFPGECRKIGTGIAITPPPGYFGAIFARSGMAAKRGLRPANCVGKLPIKKFWSF